MTRQSDSNDADGRLGRGCLTRSLIYTRARTHVHTRARATLHTHTHTHTHTQVMSRSGSWVQRELTVMKPLPWLQVP